jgi:hypothetical protein
MCKAGKHRVLSDREKSRPGIFPASFFCAPGRAH